MSFKLTLDELSGQCGVLLLNPESLPDLNQKNIELRLGALVSDEWQRADYYIFDTKNEKTLGWITEVNPDGDYKGHRYSATE